MIRPVTVLLLLLSVLVGGCSVLRGAQLWAPENAGLERVAPGLYVEAGMSLQQRTELLVAMAWAEAAIQRAYGAVRSTPIVNACASEACYERFGGMGGSRAKVYGNRILISPRALDGHFIAHEWSHAEMQKRLSLSGYLRLPSWFDEGVAVAISETPEHSEAHWQYLVSHNVPRPGRTELMSLHSLSQWLDAVHRYGEDQNRQRIARGEPRVAPLYAAAGHELRPWLATAGTSGLLRVIEALNAGDDFATAYRVAAEARNPADGSATHVGLDTP